MQLNVSCIVVGVFVIMINFTHDIINQLFHLGNTYKQGIVGYTFDAKCSMCLKFYFRACLCVEIWDSANADCLIS